MTRGDYHMHTTFCDGKSTAEEMVQSAIEKGLTRVGLSIHSEQFHPVICARDPEVMAAHRAEVARLKNVYHDRIEVLCCAECDYYFPVDKKDYDYILGSAHNLQTPDGLLAIDWSADRLMDLTAKYYNNDIFQTAEAYFATVARLAEMQPDIIAHFDLISKFNEGNRLFDSNDPRYLAAAFAAVDALLPLGVPFEINTGAISRGYRTRPYPADPILQYILAHGGKVILSSDSHAAQNVAYDFDAWTHLIPAEAWYDHRKIGRK